MYECSIFSIVLQHPRLESLSLLYVSDSYTNRAINIKALKPLLYTGLGRITRQP